MLHTGAGKSHEKNFLFPVIRCHLGSIMHEYEKQDVAAAGSHSSIIDTGW